MSRGSRTAWSMLVVAAALGQAGCGAFIARTKIVSAESAIAGARRADADKKSPYEFTAAQLYLEKAREEESAARYGAAIEFGDLATNLGDKAKLNAATAEPEPTPEP